MPGVGKTQLALKFAMLAFQKGQYPYVFWVSGVSVEKLSQDVSKMVDLLRLPGRHTLGTVGFGPFLLSTVVRVHNGW